MSNIGSSKISGMYVGDTMISQAYVGSTLVFQLSGGYDSYVIHLTAPSPNYIGMAGLRIDGVQLDAADVTSMVLTNAYSPVSYASAEDIVKAVTWQSVSSEAAYDPPWGTVQLDLNFTAAVLPNIVQMHTPPSYSGPDGLAFTLTVIGIKDGESTVLGSQQCQNHTDTVYTVNIA